ncbi:Na+/H+ antiporter [Listeria ivanovii]|uniref:Na+/H+ antiporter n=2 Tax=Listeria ivanovii TaxID=1638 RepID=A0ABS1G7G1_LISIV|nr:Na+/H+ antiporter [Listeria ivanovii]AIS60673.1 sodium:proton antiporter [Listeria ivanovii subsp. londoniensis]AIS63500.1 sodium:proton antiporter [Listeria ivanovii subsp. londoniensis]MBK1962531.1 Na+/H+ antiporter [Listeria ivanovii subsp. londoniensis]MBK1966573.1 Na+/H+ antiporter [Listeria ivanovii subsp. londoniensis]MBK1983782.1 Na+/H+ antiporter [Listeria ivanovii subsp. londoniensis]
MEIFELILLMLSAVFLSNVLSRFLPSIAVPLIQVLLGIMLAIPLGDHTMDLNPELFLLLFMAPILFNDGANTDKKSLWKNRKAILSLSIGLVFVTVGILGTFIHYLIPVIPFAAAFALAAALAPTDAVAVGALAEKVKIPHKIMHILEGESLINDASGLVSFQFAVLALVTGTFSFMTAGTSFLLLSLGGIALGAVMSLLKIILMRGLRQMGIENVTSFMLMEILLPFLIFMVAEKVGVNGILAVVSGGMVHSFSYKKINPEIAQLNLLSKNTWSVITFSLNGLVFILLGTQLPQIMETIWLDSGIHKSMLFVYILGITILLLGLRFLWILFFRNFEEQPKNDLISRFKNTFLYTVAGVRGTITLVSALSLPFVLGDGNAFPERDLLIFIAAGVIITTLLLANFTLPLFAAKKDVTVADHEADIVLLRDVVNQLQAYKTDENMVEMNKVLKMYNDRIFSLMKHKEVNTTEKELRRLTQEWQLENTRRLVFEKKIDTGVGLSVMMRLGKRLYVQTREEKYRARVRYRQMLRHGFRSFRIVPLSFEERRKERIKLQRENNEFIVQKLHELDNTEYSPEIISLYLITFEQSLFTKDAKRESDVEELQTTIDLASQIERETIQRYFEKGDITRKEMKVYRDNLLAIEASFQL